MKLEKIPGGYALYKEKTIIGTCQARPTAQGADITALTIVPEWRRKGYGSYLLKEVLRSLGGYDKESATVFTAPLPADAGELAFWAKFGFAAEGSGLCRRRTPRHWNSARRERSGGRRGGRAAYQLWTFWKPSRFHRMRL